MSVACLGGYTNVDLIPFVCHLFPSGLLIRHFVIQFPVETPGHPHNVPMLMNCIAKVPRLLGCEAAYYFPKDLDFCHMPEEREGLGDESAGGESDQEEAGAVDRSQEQDGTRGGAGNLVIHIRSGDIFSNEVLADYGQVMCIKLIRYL